MSISKVKQFYQSLVVTSDTVSGTGPYTHTLVTPTHYMSTGDTVNFGFNVGTGLESQSTPITYISATSFSVSLATPYAMPGGQVLTKQYYSAGQTGGMPSMSCPVNVIPAVVQVVSTGAATLNIEVSLDNVNFVSIKTVTLGAAGSDYTTIAAAWAYVRVNITSVTATKSVSVYLAA